MSQLPCQEATRRLAEALHSILTLADHLAAHSNEADYDTGHRICVLAQSICDQVEIVSKSISRMDPRIARILEDVAREKAAEDRRNDYRQDLLLLNSPAEPDWNPPY
jgi:hypothetical protein